MAKAKDPEEPTPAPKPKGKEKHWFSKISGAILGASGRKPPPPTGVQFASNVNPFAAAKPPPGVVPTERRESTAEPVMANDENIVAHCKFAQDEFNLPVAGGAGIGYTALSQGYSFLGYTYLAELSQIPEYRRISEVIATEMTREWIRFVSVSDDKDKSEQIKQLEEEFKRLKVQDIFQTLALQDGFFGRAHLYFDTGDGDNRQELMTPLGDGWDEASKLKVKKGKLKALRVVEAVWCYPSRYNSNDPLAADWYHPTTWFCMGKELHASRLVRFVAREVPDLLKPAYSFGGMSLTQMAKPYVDNWLRTRQAVSDLVYKFSTWILKTNLQDSLSVAGSEMFDRAKLFNNMGSNFGLFMINSAPNSNDDESVENKAVPLTTLDVLQAQAQEHMCSVSAIPKIKLLGLDPAGLNASSEDEIQVFDDSIRANQTRLFTSPIRRVMGFAMLNIWGKTDPDISFTFEPLRSLDPKEEAEKAKAEADTDVVYVEAGVLHAEEVRKRLASKPDSPYSGLDVSDVPEPPALGEESPLGEPKDEK